jgi:hypothetical protein
MSPRRLPPLLERSLADDLAEDAFDLFDFLELSDARDTLENRGLLSVNSGASSALSAFIVLIVLRGVEGSSRALYGEPEPLGCLSSFKSVADANSATTRSTADTPGRMADTPCFTGTSVSDEEPKDFKTPSSSSMRSIVAPSLA